MKLRTLKCCLLAFQTTTACEARSIPPTLQHREKLMRLRDRGGNSSSGDEESGQADTGQKIKPAVSASRSTRKRTSLNLPLTENAVEDQAVQPTDRVLLPVPPKRGRRRMISSEGSEDRDLDRPALSLPPAEPPVAPRRSARKRAQNLLAGTPTDLMTRRCPVCR